MKKSFLKYFPSCKTFNINLNTFIPISTIQLQNELLSKKSFKHLLSYHLYNYMNRINKENLIGETTIGNSFLEHLIKIVKTEEGITRKDIEKKVDKNKDIINEKEIIEIIKELKNFCEKKEIVLGIKEEDFKKEEKKKGNLLSINFSKMDSKGKINDNIDEINPSYIIKLLYIYQKENKLIPPLSEETINLLNYFKSKSNIIIKNEDNKQVIPSEKAKLNKRIINSIKEVLMKMEQPEFSGKEIKQVIKNMHSTIEYLEIYDVIFIPFLGPSNAGKSTIINGIIGQEVLPTELRECTKRGIIIRYCEDYQKDINIRKAIFRQNDFLGKMKYFFEADDVIAQGLKNVQDTLKGLNYEFTDKQEDSFYYIRTKIKLFDDLGIDNYFKKLIYIIDFPGYGTNNKFEQFLFNKVASICNSFMFVVRNSLIKEEHNQNAFRNIFNQVMQQKNEFSSGFIKSCLFILNNDDTQEINEKELEKSKEDIQYIIKNIKKEDLNVCFFNAKFYSNFIDNFNYFINIKNTINSEFKEYKKYQADIFKNPNNYKSKKYDRFGDYFYTKVVEKIEKGGFGTSIESDEEINEDILSQIEEILKDLELYDSLTEDDYTSEHINIFAQIFSFAQRNFNNLNSLKESNVEELKKNFLNQINNVNEEKQNELKNNLYKEIKILDFFFNQSFSHRKKDLELFKIFKEEVNKIYEKINKLSENCKKKMHLMRKTYEKNAHKSLIKKQKEIEKLLQKKNWKLIKNEINKEMIDNLKNLNTEIDILFNDIDNNSTILFKKAINLFLEFTDKKMDLNDIYMSFEDYFKKNALKEEKVNILDEITKALKECNDNSLQKIFDVKGFFPFFISVFSDDTYISNLIQVIIECFSDEIDKIFQNLRTHFIAYTGEIIRIMTQNVNSIAYIYSNNQEKEWTELCKIYKSKRELIYQDLNNLIGIKNN